jgi:hypothetical protein
MDLLRGLCSIRSRNPQEWGIILRESPRKPQLGKIFWGRCGLLVTHYARSSHSGVYLRSAQSGRSCHSGQVDLRTQSPSGTPSRFCWSQSVSQASYKPHRLSTLYSPSRIGYLDRGWQPSRPSSARPKHYPNSTEAYIRLCSTKHSKDIFAGIFIGSFFGG